MTASCRVSQIIWTLAAQNTLPNVVVSIMATSAMTTSAVAAMTAANGGKRPFTAAEALRYGNIPVDPQALSSPPLSTRGSEMEKAARKLFDACSGPDGVMRR